MKIDKRPNKQQKMEMGVYEEEKWVGKPLVFLLLDFVVIFGFLIYIHNIQNINIKCKYVWQTEKHTLPW